MRAAVLALGIWAAPGGIAAPAATPDRLPLSELEPVNWKASYDFPYMGMFLPPIPDTERYPRLAKGNTTSIAQLRDYSTRMRRMGFEVLNFMAHRARPAANLAAGNVHESMNLFPVIHRELRERARGRAPWIRGIGSNLGPGRLMQPPASLWGAAGRPRCGRVPGGSG